jgi:hypothetical protein
MRPAAAGRFPALTSQPIARREWLRGDALPAALIAVTIALSVLVMTVPFLGKQWLLGDLAYHRGVTLSINLAHPFGEGPIAGVMSYYGGLYHLLLAGFSRIFGLTFEQAIAVLSLIWAVVWPVSLVVLGRRLWPGDRSALALFTAVGTLVMPLTTSFAADLWVESVVPSGMAFWPAYPRDLAVSFGIFATAFFLDPQTVRRRVGAGVFLALAIATHPQIAATSAAVIAAWAAFRAVRGDGSTPLFDVLVAGGLAGMLSAWWWLPRVGPILAGPALLADAPDRLPFRMTPEQFVLQLSWLGVVALGSLALLVLRRRTPGGHPILTIWLAVIVPLLVFDRLAGGSAVAPERRTWLQLSIPLAAIAAYELLAMLRRLGRPAAGALLAAGLIALSVPAMLATLGGLARVWEDRRIAGRPWPAAEWDAVFTELRGMSRDGPDEILTYDTEAPWVWSFTGARVFSLWLPGSIKLGFDPQIYTGIGYLERVRLADNAFARGMDGICKLAAKQDIHTLVLRSLDDLVGTYDHPFAAPFRTNPAERSQTPSTRSVGPGVTYLDTGPDWLQVEPDVDVAIPFISADVRTIVVEVRNVTPDDRVRLTLRSGDTVRRASTDLGTTVQALRFDLPRRRPREDLTIRADGEVMLLRALGYEQVGFAHPRDGAFVTTTEAACAAPRTSGALLDPWASRSSDDGKIATR